MLEPNDIDSTAELAEDACKSDYYSDEGDAKIDSVNVENGSSSKREPENRVEESKKVKISNECEGKSISDFPRAGSVTSDNSDEFVDASDVFIEPVSQDKKSKNSTDVDSSAIKSSVASDTFRSSIFDSETPKVKDNKFLKRLPTFADDPLDRFNSSAIRRGLVRESEPVKSIDFSKLMDFNFDFRSSEKNETKSENKTVKKVKLNRSKFLSAGKPKCFDDSSSDSNSRNNLVNTSPAKSDQPLVDQKEGNFKNIGLKSEDKPQFSVTEKIIPPTKPPPLVTNFCNEVETAKIPPEPSQIQQSSNVPANNLPKEPSPVPVENTVDDQNIPVSVTLPESCSEKEIVESETSISNENQLINSSESKEDLLQLDTNEVPQSLENEISKTNQLLEIDNNLPEETTNLPQNADDLNENINIVPVQDEVKSIPQIISEPSIEKPEIQSIQQETNFTENNETEPNAEVCPTEAEIPLPQETNDFTEEVNSEEFPLEVEKPEESLSETAIDEDISTENIGSATPDLSINEESEVAEKIDDIETDVISDNEDLAEDRTDSESSDGSEGEEEEAEEEEEIHEEEVYLEDRIPIVEKPKEKSPSPEPSRRDHDVMVIDDDEPEILPPPTVEKPIEPEKPCPPCIENIENIPMDIDENEPDRQKPKEISKLEQALIGKPMRKMEVQVPSYNETIGNSNDTPVERQDSEETKEKIKLHISLQGDKVSIKKGPLVTPTGEVRVKRQYRKRRLEHLNDPNLNAADKTYKLRNRTVKKDEDTQASVQSNGNVEVVNITDRPIEVSDEKRVSDPVTIDLDSINAHPAKLQPIKLKISNKSNVIIECGPSAHSETEKSREEFRKKESISNYMEKAATAWSGPDLQRVERLLKESNITITPVVPKETQSHQILKPILMEKDKSAFTTPMAVSTSSSLQTSTASTACATPTNDESSADEVTDNGDLTNVSLDDETGRFKHINPDDSDISINDKVDVKSEIRKKLACSEKRKQEFHESNDSESESDSKPKKSLPEGLPVNFPTPEMLQSLANSFANASDEDGKKPEINAALLPLLQTLPKKRGRPTKAMVAAREALKQSQEAALENLKQLASQNNAESKEIMAHFSIPLFDITDPENLFKPKRGRKPKSDRYDKSDGDQSAMEDTILDPIREAEEYKRLEEERIKREEERERKNEIRRQKAKERNDLVKAKRLRQKMKAEERQRRMQEKRRLLQEEKKKLEEEIKNLPSTLTGFDDETRMSAENSQLQSMSFNVGMLEDDSSNATAELTQRIKKSRMEVTDADSKDLTVDQIAEYQWPIQGGDLYMIQEQVSNYLGVKSFKRKYPDIKRRPVDSEERAYLVDSGLVSETLCDLGLTAVSSAEVLDIMCADFPDKYEELRRYMREKQMKELSFKQKAWANGLGYKLLMADGTKQDLKKRAMESASNWNSALNKSRGEDRRCAMDLQTYIIHYPKNRTQKMSISTPKMGSYPVSILPGQFCDFYKHYTCTELRYMPVNTVLYGPLKPHAVPNVGDGSQTDSDDSSSSDESSAVSECTQATEDTIEDTDKDMSVDESSQLDKTHDVSLLKEQMTMELSENTRELIIDEASKILCKICLGNMSRNKENVPEVLIYCSQCSSTSHPTCLDLSLDMVPQIKKYAWQCPDCKICARCKENADEDKMLFCDTCDRGYHIYCVGLKKVPSGRWQCQECTTENVYINSREGLIEIQDD